MRRPALGLLVAAGLWLALEAGSLLVVRFEPRSDPFIASIRPEWDATRVYDPELFWRLRPGGTANARRRAADGSWRPDPANSIRINAAGLRDEEIAPRDPGVFRVLSLGESTTFGYGIAAEDSYGEILERELSPVAGRRLEVINAGVPGYSLFQGWAYLSGPGLALEPDAVLLYFGFNDFLPVAYRQERDAASTRQPGGLDDWSLHLQRQRPLARLDAWLYRHSNVYRGLDALLPRPEPADREVLFDVNARPRVPAQHREMLLGKILALCRQAGVQLTLVVPWYRDFDAHAPLLRRFAALEGVTVVDLPRRLDRLPRRGSYFLDRAHPNEAGHRLIAREIEAVVAPAWEKQAARSASRALPAAAPGP